PGIANVSLGIFAGMLLKEGKYSGVKKVQIMVIAGIISIGLALLWNLDFPFNKNLWSSSFVLLTGGLSLLLLALFYYIIDVRGYKKWSFFLKVIGMNSILIYVSPVFIHWDYTANALFKWLGQLAGETYGPFVLAFSAVLIQWLFLYFLYKKKVFLKV
ncbi:MAG: DUF5009 domain-containing protein, partial [Chitinophagaceae bacterium]|nr:DUF5009 domain-containing protein [Chitinophagaceae bacterium]